MTMRLDVVTMTYDRLMITFLVRIYRDCNGREWAVQHYDPYLQEGEGR